ncbi:MAG: carboxypeptidase regulatory-like domain-containing protein, partial [Bacteroidota bacterium]
MKITSLSAVGLFIAIITMAPLPAHAQQTGNITGTIVDASTGEPVIRATVRINGTKLGALTSTSGAYTVKNVPPGLYGITVSYVGYGTKSLTNVRVDPGSTARQDVGLSTAMVGRDTITVTAHADRRSESAALIERKRSASVSDAISADQIAKAPASDAGEAMKRVT